MRFALAIILAAHGVAHLVGFVSSWQLAALPELPYKTTIFAGRLDVGDVGMRTIGVLWLLAALMFLVAAIAMALQVTWAVRLTLVGLVASLLMCVAGWPDTRIGLALNVGLLFLLVIEGRLRLFTLSP